MRLKYCPQARMCGRHSVSAATVEFTRWGHSYPPFLPGLWSSVTHPPAHNPVYSHWPEWTCLGVKRFHYACRNHAHREPQGLEETPPFSCLLLPGSLEKALVMAAPSHSPESSDCQLLLHCHHSHLISKSGEDSRCQKIMEIREVQRQKHDAPTILLPASCCPRWGC